MINKEVLRLQLVPGSQVEEMVEMLAAQGRRLHELEVKLQQEQQAKANLLVDFQHLLDQIQLKGAVVCG